MLTDEDLKTILACYPIDDQNVTISKVLSGNTANTYCVRSQSESFILRELQDKTQGENERVISEHLLQNGVVIVPQIKSTDKGDPIVQYHGRFYNLQEYINGRKIKSSDETAVEQIAHTVSLLQSTLDTGHLKNERQDRFGMQDLWEDVKDEWSSFFEQGNIRELLTADRRIFLTELDRKTNGHQAIIHGDLGIWNMLMDGKGRVMIIDFGEARMGDPYFDIAAALTSSVGMNAQQETVQKLSAIFIESYEQNGSKLEMLKLMDFVQLWVLRGILAGLKYSKQENLLVKQRVLSDLKLLEYYKTAFLGK